MEYTTLISAAELVRHIDEPGWIVLDCRHELTRLDAGREAYAAGHIPGAQFIDLETELSDKRAGPNGEFRGRHPLPEPSAFIETLRRFSINHDSQVVAYDAQGGMFAARLWWMLHWIGHRRAAVLDGGLQAWQAQDQPLSMEAAARSRGNIALRPSRMPTVSASEVLANLEQATRTVIDARAPDRFCGENETLDPVGGHIPGARNRFFKNNLQADGRFKSSQLLRAEFTALGVAPEAAIMQCGSGATACHNLLAMEVAGLHGAALYAGSWSEWCTDPSRPVATGD